MGLQPIQIRGQDFLDCLDINWPLADDRGFFERPPGVMDDLKGRRQAIRQRGRLVGEDVGEGDLRPLAALAQPGEEGIRQG